MAGILSYDNIGKLVPERNFSAGLSRSTATKLPRFEFSWPFAISSLLLLTDYSKKTHKILWEDPHNAQLKKRSYFLIVSEASIPDSYAIIRLQ